MKWQQLSEDLWRFRDSCNVYAVHGTDGMVIIDAGTGYWLDQFADLPSRPSAVLLTHHFRDHAAGAVRAARKGIDVFAPEYEHEMLADVEQHLRERQTYIIYDNLWDLNVPIESIPGVAPFPDYDTKTIAGLQIESVPLPGATLGQTGYAMTLPATGRRVVFCGEAIHSPGRVPRIAPYQYNYNCTTGTWNAICSARQLRKRGFDTLLPSMGEPIVENVEVALTSLEDSLKAVLDSCGRGDIDLLPETELPDLTRVTEHVYVSTHSNARSWILLNDDFTKAMAIDYGYASSQVHFQGLSVPKRRRALLHGLDGLKERFDIDRIEVALISHFHDDHVCGVPVLQRLFGTQCWASDVFADLLAMPEGHCFPCNWHIPCRIDKRIGLDQTVRWEQYEFRFGAMSGHTRFASLIGFEVDGKRFAHTGDQYFFRNGEDHFTNNRIMPNHVYRNGCLLGGHGQSAAWILNWRPDIVLTGHTEAFPADDHYFGLIDRWTEEIDTVHRSAMVLGDDEAHLDMDSWGGWIWPFRTHLAQPGPVNVTVAVRNPLPHKAKLEVRLIGPAGWDGDSATLEAPPRAEVKCDMTITASGACRRQSFAAELIADGQPFGQVADAQVTVGGKWF